MNQAAHENYLVQFGEAPGYLDFAKVGPISRAVLEARNDAAARLYSADEKTVAELESARGSALSVAAGLLNLPVDQVTDTPNTSTGLFQVAFALRPRGDRDQVLVSADEFPSNRYPWVRAEHAGGLAPVFIRPENGRMSAAAIGDAVTDRTAAVAVSVVDFRTGYVTDLRAIRERIGDRLLIVDGIQGFGVLPLDWQAADAVVVGGQKWLRSGWGTGFVALSERLSEAAEPLLAGWTGVEDPVGYDGTIHERRAGAGALSITNLSAIDHAALEAGLRLVDSVGVGWIAARIRARAGELAGLLRGHGALLHPEAGGAEGSGIVSFSMPGSDAGSLHDHFTAQGIACTRHGDRIRLSVHASTGSSAIEMVEKSLASFP